MFYKQIIENNKSNLNTILIFDVLSLEDVVEFIQRNNMEDRFTVAEIAEKWNLLDHHLQQIKASHADKDLKEALEKIK